MTFLFIGTMSLHIESGRHSMHCNQMKVHIVLFSSTVISTAVSYDVFNSHYIII